MAAFQDRLGSTEYSTFRYEDLQGLMSIMTGDEKHSEAATSTLDVIWTLYDRVLDIDPDDPTNPDRDRFFLSKGHGPMAYYAVLAAKGFINPSELDGFATAHSILGHHPDHRRIPGVEISSGSLGMGLALGIGAAFAMRIAERDARLVVLMGDGELDEGSNHEAIATAARLGLGKLTAIVIDNQSATYGWPGGIEQRFAVEGWATAVVNGRDHAEIAAAFETKHPNRPLAVVAKVASKR